MPYSTTLSELRISVLASSTALSELRISTLPYSMALLELRISALPIAGARKISRVGRGVRDVNNSPEPQIIIQINFGSNLKDFRITEISKLESGRWQSPEIVRGIFGCNCVEISATTDFRFHDNLSHQNFPWITTILKSHRFRRMVEQCW